MSNLVRSASLTNYAEVARVAGLDPQALLAGAGLSPTCLNDPDLRIPADAVRSLLEASAQASGLDNFGLRMAETRRLSNLGPVALVATRGAHGATRRAGADVLQPSARRCS